MKGVAFLSLISLASLGVANHGLASDFSLTSNPNGVWSYGFSTGQGDFTLYTNNIAVQDWYRATAPGIVGWSPNSGAFPFLAKNDSDIEYNGAWHWLARETVLHAFLPDRKSVARFTAPGDYRYLVTGSFRRIENSGNPSTYALMANGATLLSGNLFVRDQSQPFSFQWPANAGDRLDAVVGFSTQSNGTALATDLRLEKLTQDVSPDSFAVKRGRYVSGGLPEVLLSDDQYLFVQDGITIGSLDSPVQVEYHAVSPFTTVSRVKLWVEAAASVPNIGFKLECFNFEANAWESVANGATSTNDQTFVFQTSTNASRFVDPATGSIRAKTSYKPLGPLVTLSWLVREDFVHWTVDPS